MSTFAQLGKPLRFGSLLLIPGTLTGNLLVPLVDEWTDIYTIVVTTNDTAVLQVTISDGTTSIVYFVGGSTSNPPVLDQGSTPIRFRKGATIVATASAITAAKSVAINVRGLSSKT